MRLHEHTLSVVFFFFNDTATTEIYTLSLHDALPIFLPFDRRGNIALPFFHLRSEGFWRLLPKPGKEEALSAAAQIRSEEHTSELQSRQYLVCRLLLEKKKKKNFILYIR